MKKEGNILVVDDNKNILESCVQLLKHDFGNIITLSNPNQIPMAMNRDSFDVIMLDMNFRTSINSGNEGLYWLRKILEIDPHTVVIMITAYGSIDLAVEAIKEGAYSFIQKPWEPGRLIATIQSGIKLRNANIELNNLRRIQKTLNYSSSDQGERIIGNSGPLTRCISLITKVAETDANILLTGENGTGKELFAKEIHRLSSRRNRIFVPVDMGSVAASLFESELFGHVKGAFTDAREDRLGRVELASGGTLFLDEIGNLPMILQSKILSTIENRYIIPVGSNNRIDVDIRIISATNMNLRQMVAEGLFREDLLYRLNTVEVEIPPLRDRGEDIVRLTNHFLEKFSKLYKKEGLRITGKAYDAIMSHKWPGNVRELKHSVERAVILAGSGLLKPSDFFSQADQTTGEYLHNVRTLAAMERELIVNALEKNGMNISNAARDLDISRSTLYSKMRKYDL
jgi:DNA-binding NtrC family response regulator